MNLGELRTALQAKGYTTDTVDAQNAALNETYRRICGSRRWPFLLSTDIMDTTAGLPAYVGPSDVREVVAVSITLADGSGVVLDYLTDRDARARLACNEAPGVPDAWSVEGGNVVLCWPTPDAVYSLKIEYISTPPALVADTDEPLIPEQYQDALVLGAVASSVAFRERDWSAYQEASVERDTIVLSMARALGSIDRPSPGIRKSYWYTRPYVRN